MQGMASRHAVLRRPVARAQMRAARRAAPVGEPAALLAQVGEAQRSASTRSSSVASSSVSTPARAERLAQLASRAARRRRAKRLRKPRVVGVDDQLLAGLGVAASSPGRGRAGPSRAGRTGAPPSPRGAAPAGPAAFSQPGALMKSETTKSVERRLIVRCAASSSSRRSVAPRGRFGGRAPPSRCSRCSTWTPAAARRQHGVDVGAVEQGADAVAVARQQARQHGDELARDACAW